MQPLSELVDRFAVYALCLPCGRMEALDVAGLLQRLGASSTLDDLRPRLRCRVCGMRSQELRVVYVGPAGRAIVFQYRRERGPRPNVGPHSNAGPYSNAGPHAGTDQSNSGDSSVSPKPPTPT
ncbi:MAG: hypothetical protein ACKOZX_06830 [Gammaproteobacteria bacterium]